MRHVPATADEFYGSHANIEPNDLFTLPIELNSIELSSLEGESVASVPTLQGKTSIFANFEHVSFFHHEEHGNLENLGTDEVNSAISHNHKPRYSFNFQHSMLKSNI